MYSTVYHWFHTRCHTFIERTMKFLLAAVIYAFICYVITAIFDKIERYFKKKGADSRMLTLILKPIDYSLKTFVLALIVVQWVVVENSRIADKIKIMTYEEVQEWLHSESNSILDYVLKVIVALSVFVIISGLLNKIVKTLVNKLSGVNFSQKLIRITAGIVSFSIQIFVAVASVIQLFLVDYNMLTSLVVIGCILLVALFKLRKINFRGIISGMGIEDVELVSDSKMNKVMGVLYSFIYIVVGVVFVFFAGFSISRGVHYLTGYGGEEISSVVSYSEARLAKKYGTTFAEDESLVSEVPHLKDAEVKVHTNGDLNVIYVNGTQLGLNTSSRKYKVYGVSINEPEYEAIESMTYKYEGYAQTLDNITSASVSTYYYYNKVRNDCLVLAVSKSTNRVVSVTYFKDYETISKLISIAED